MTHPNLPHPSELTRQVPVFPALKRRRQHQSNIWFFDSPKNNARLTIRTDVAFMHLVILEGDTTVRRYVPSPGQELVIIDNEQVPVEVGAHVHLEDGTVEWWDFKSVQKRAASRRSKSEPQPADSVVARAAASVRAIYRIKTDADLAGQEILFDNWLTLCAAMNRCRNQFIEKEVQLLFERLRQQQSVPLESLLSMPGIDVAHMLAAIGIALQGGTARASLSNQIFGRSTTLSRGAA